MMQKFSNVDEPLSNLDAKLRVHMRAKITKLHQRLQTTTIYVTHDQTEAMTMATRLVVMKDETESYSKLVPLKRCTKNLKFSSLEAL